MDIFKTEKDLWVISPLWGRFKSLPAHFNKIYFWACFKLIFVKCLLEICFYLAFDTLYHPRV